MKDEKKKAPDSDDALKQDEGSDIPVHERFTKPKRIKWYRT